MNFQAYYSKLDSAGKKSLAESLGTSPPYLSQLAHGHRVASRMFASRVEVATKGRVKAAEMLFPPAKNRRTG